MKAMILIIAALTMVGCTGQDPIDTTGNTVCLRGVSYYMFKSSVGNQGFGYLAPVFNKDTKQVELCPTYPR